MHRLFVLGLWAVLALAALVAILGVFATRGHVDLSGLPRIEIDGDVRARAAALIAEFTAATERARGSGKSEPVQITLGQDELTALIDGWRREDHWFGTVRELQVALLPGTLAITGVIESLGLEIPFRIDVAVVVENNTREVEVTRLQAGELFAPGFLRTVMLELASRTLDAGLPRVPVDIETLVVGNGEVIVSGHALP